MVSEALPAERLRQYLSELKLDTRALLIAELERSLLRGDDMPGADLVLQELRRTVRRDNHPGVRTDKAARAFFAPLEPFIVDDAPVREHPGRITRASLDPIWAWICRDLVPNEARTFSENIDKAVIAGDKAGVELLTRAMQEQVVQAMGAAFAAADTDGRANRRLAGQFSIANGVQSARELLALLKSREALTAFGAQLPGHFNTLTDGRVVQIKTLLDATHAKNPGIFVHALITVMSRLAASWQLIRLATKAADSDKAARIAATPYAAAVDIVLAEVERLVSELKGDLKSGRGIAVVALLKVIHDAARGLRTEMELSVDSAWGRRLAAIRKEISSLLKSEIESAPGRLRRLLRPRPAKEIVPASVLHEDDIAEVEALIGFVDACRKYAGELALNEMTLRSFSEVQQYLEAGWPALLEGLRKSGEADRPFRQSQVDAALRCATKVFGPEYAATLRKAADLVVGNDRKSRAS